MLKFLFGDISGDNITFMGQSKQSQLIHIWEDYEFYLNIPKTFTGSNKPFVYFYYFNPKSNKSERIRKYIPKNGGNIKKIKDDAKTIIKDLVVLLTNQWSPITNELNETTISSLSTILNCIDYWLSKREEAYNNNSIGWKALKNNRILMLHFKSYLNAVNLLHNKAITFNNQHIKEFLDAKAFERSWGKVTYNTYLVDLGTFFNYLVDLKILLNNPCNKVVKKSTRFDSSRFKVFEKEELITVSSLLNSDVDFFGLNVASKILFKYNIRPLELTRLQVKDIDLVKSRLTIPPTKTKNENEAIFQLDEQSMELIKLLIGQADENFYIFGRRNKPSDQQVCSDYFGQRWRAFRKKHNLAPHLKLYALKHTSNYYDIEDGASYEEIRQRNRHANLQVTTLYIKERLFKNIIKPSKNKLF